MRSRWFTVAVMSIAYGVTLWDWAMVSLSMPAIQRGFELGPGLVHWAEGAFSVTIASVLLLGGCLADRWPRLTILRIGLGFFLVGAFVNAMAPAFGVLIFGRVLQGLGYALIAPTAVVLAAEAFDAASRGRALGVFNAIGTVLLLSSPLVVGVALQFGSWRLGFAAAGVVGVVAFAVTLLFRAAPRDAAAGGVPYAQALLFAVAVPLVLSGIDRLGASGWDVLTAGLLAGGVLLLVVFLAIQMWSPRCLLDIKMLRDRNLAGAALSVFAMGLSISAVAGFLALSAKVGIGLPSAGAGLLMTAFLLPPLASGPLSGWLHDCRGPRVACFASVGTLALGMCLMVYSGFRRDPALVALALLVAGAGVGAVLTVAYTGVVTTIPEAARAKFFALFKTIQTFGESLGLVLVAGVASGELLYRIWQKAPFGNVVLEELLVGSSRGEPDALAQLAEDFPGKIEPLREAVAAGIGLGQLVIAGFLAVALVAVVLIMRPKERACGS